MVIFTFFCFILEIPVLEKFGPENQNCHFKLKFAGIMQKLTLMLIFSVLNWKLFLQKFDPRS